MESVWMRTQDFCASKSGFGVVRSRTEVYFEHVSAEKGETRYPRWPSKSVMLNQRLNVSVFCYSKAMSQLTSPLDGMFSSSKKLILDFSKINENTPDEENFEKLFNDYKNKNLNPREPINRQQINNLLSNRYGYRYLVGQYGEDRTAMLEDTPAGKSGRVIHMAIDVFSKSLETIYSPCDGVIVRSDYEEGFGEYGNYIIIRPKECDYYVFFGHLSSNKPIEKLVSMGEAIARLGDYTNNENGGWSRHLHIQILKELPAKGVTPDGYSTKKDFVKNSLIYPNPLDYFPEWKLR